MEEWKNEAEARGVIKAMVSRYYNDFKMSKPYVKGDRIPYAGRVYDEAEICALTDAALDFWLTSGHFAQEFEDKFAGFRFGGD
jgi:CDP-6-deoxy-D-xylo-4-hexulose-3-dehydrase